MVGIAQLVRAPDCGSGCRGFESHYPPSMNNIESEIEMLLYRYEFVKNDYRVGFLTGLDDFFTDEEIFACCWIFEKDLADPCISMSNTKSYFTEKGNRKFRKKIKEIQKLAESKGIIFDTIIRDSSEITDILYSDDYQVVVLD